MRKTEFHSKFHPKSTSTKFFSAQKWVQKEVQHKNGKIEEKTDEMIITQEFQSHVKRKSNHDEIKKIHKKHAKADSSDLVTGFRRWIPIRFPKEGSQQIRVVTYNILADSAAKEHRGYLYPRVPNEHLLWEYRLTRIINEMKQLNADILCLQEVEFYDIIYSKLKELGYDGNYLKRKGETTVDGCAIFWKENKLTKIEESMLEFDKKGISWLDKPNVAICMTFQLRNETPENEPKKFCIGTTHLLYNPKRGDIKLGQAKLLMDEMNRLTQNGKLPMILCGDFNCTPFSPLYEFLSSGSLPLMGLNIGSVSGQERTYGHKFLTKEQMTDLSENSDGNINHKFDIQSTYRHKNTYLVSSYHTRFSGNVDYIWYEPKKFQLCSILSLPNRRNVRELLGDSLPNEIIGSDHLSCAADLSIY